MSWYLPLGLFLLTIIGKIFISISILAISRGLYVLIFSRLISTGAPRANCNALEPSILARSYFVNLGGPIFTRNFLVLPLIIPSWISSTWNRSSLFSFLFRRSSCYDIIYSKYHYCCFSSRLYSLLLY